MVGDTCSAVGRAVFRGIQASQFILASQAFMIDFSSGRSEGDPRFRVWGPRWVVCSRVITEMGTKGGAGSEGKGRSPGKLTVSLVGTAGL